MDDQYCSGINQLHAVTIRVVASGIVALSAIFAVQLVFVTSPTWYEVGHLPAGIVHWREATFSLYRVNPPLPRMLAVAPLLLLGARYDGPADVDRPQSRGEIPAGILFAQQNSSRLMTLFVVARCTQLSFWILGAWACFAWSRRLYGTRGAMVSLALWCWHPLILANAALIMPDVPAAAIAACAGLAFDRWLSLPSMGNSIRIALAGGAALLCKFTLLVLAPLLICGMAAARWRMQAKCSLQIGVVIVGMLYVIHAGYGFQKSFCTIGDMQFLSTAFGGVASPDGQVSGNRFDGTIAEHLPLFLPMSYVQGIDRQKTDFEIGEKSYFCGRWKQGGWWYYHLVGLLLKTPPGFVLIGVLACVVSPYRVAGVSLPREFLCILLPAVIIIGLVSCNTGFSNHVRYCIPALPFLCIWCGRITAVSCRYYQVFERLTWILVGSGILSVIAVHPHELSYTTEAVGGSRCGHQFYLDSNYSCGQDLLHLKRWLDKQRIREPIRLAVCSWVNPSAFGIDFTIPPALDISRETQDSSENDNDSELSPGWYVVDVNLLHGTIWPVVCPNDQWQKIPITGKNYTYFQHLRPVASIGYSLLIFDITEDDLKSLRSSTPAS